jgi:hypothetical protein
MASEGETPQSQSLSADEREWLESVREAETLAELTAITGIDSEHEAYFQAKSRWKQLREIDLAVVDQPSGLPGDTVRVGDQEFVVHGITHANTDEERAYLQEHVSSFLENRVDILCEQGIRRMYFADMPEVYQMDDYRWAMYHCKQADIDSHVEEMLEPEFEELANNLSTMVSQFRNVTFSLIETGSEVFGDQFAEALGDVASDFLMGHEERSTAEDFVAFRKLREAASDPTALGELQRYYKKAFLPQPIEREWLRRHDRELELVTHARNERMADYAIYHADAPRVHLIVGAAHQPGVVYYLDQHRTGKRSRDDFELIE